MQNNSRFLEKLSSFFLVTLLIRCVHSYFTIYYHIGGDLSLPWLMANDWELTKSNKYFWGQNYMPTQEVWFLNKLGRLLGFSIIPMWLNVFIAQLFYTIGVTLIFSKLKIILYLQWQNRWFYLALLSILIFAPPAFQKYTFGIGTGYAMVPLATGLSIYLALTPQIRLWKAFLGCIILGISISVFRLNAVSVAGLILIMITVRPKENVKLIGVMALGVAMGLLPEFLQSGLNSPYGFKIPEFERIAHNIFYFMTEQGVNLGILPYSWFEGEHAMWFWGHKSFPTDFMKIARYFSILLFLLILLINFGKTKERHKVFYLIIVINLVVVCFSNAYIDVFSARRYGYPMSLALTALILFNINHVWNKIFLIPKFIAILFYLYSSFVFWSPLQRIPEILAEQNYDTKLDCIAGNGAILTTHMALTSKPVSVVEQGWRLTGNYSKTIPHDEIRKIKEEVGICY